MAKDKSAGYGKPPRHSQFRKGKSGNTRGRPKGATNAVMALVKALGEPVAITENGKRKTITKIEAIMKQAVNRAAGGDPKATQQLINLFRVFGNQIPADESNFAPIVLNIVGVESDGNGNPLPEGAVKRRVKESDPGARPSLWETDSEGNITVLGWDDR